MLRKDELIVARTSLARAFDADPLFQFLFPREKQRRRWLDIIMAGTIAETLADNHVFVPTSPAGGPAVGVMAIVPPNAYPTPSSRDWQFIWNRRERPSFSLPPFRLLRSAFPALSAIRKLHIKQPHYYLQTVGVHPDHKGKGVGGLFMRELCDMADQAGVAAYLETSNPANLGFYRRFRFEELDRLDTPGGGPPIWTMLRV